MDEPFIKPTQQLPELTLAVFLASIALAIVLAASNAYLALKVGILTSASIPAAVMSMGIFKFIRGSNVLQNNLVQTAASAGEAIAGGVVFTVPALIILRYWGHFPYWECVAISLLGGILGVLFSIPLRRILVTDPTLNFPEGKAIAEVLIAGSEKTIGLKNLLLGGAVGGLIEAAQTGFKVLGNSISTWWMNGQTLFGFGVGYSATLIGAGYLMGFNVGVSMLMGALLGWAIGVPVLSHVIPLSGLSASAQGAMGVWEAHLCYIGIGAMITAGLWTLLTLFKPFIASMRSTRQAFSQRGMFKLAAVRTEQDLPLSLVMIGVVILALLLLWFFDTQISVMALGLPTAWTWPFLIGCVFYILVIGFLFSAICGYFSGMVGVTASPGSAIVIAGLLLAAIGLSTVLKLAGTPTPQQILLAQAVTIMLGAVITGAACIANDNIQDLKVGHLVGATPWRQQLMLMLGAVVSSLVIPPVMELLFNVYGIGGVFPHPGMDPTQMLAAPPAALMATITRGVFSNDLPWSMIGIGSLISIIAIFARSFLERYNVKFSVLGIAIGIYLPWSTTTALFIGALFAAFAQHGLRRSAQPERDRKHARQKGILLACGIVAGAALMDVILAIPMAATGNPDVLQLVPAGFSSVAQFLGLVAIALLGVWFYRIAVKRV